jgi:SAM-dependent methyltransferase
MDGSAYSDGSKLDVLLGQDFWDDVEGKVVIDFGCGEGHQAIEMARRGARSVIGIDIREAPLKIARDASLRAGVAESCSFTTKCEKKADVIVSLDSFEHFDDPASVLEVMASLLKPGGCVWASFGPTWLHPRGGHLFSVFPWAHLIFTEAALIRWRSDFKTDGATRFTEVSGGLNRITIGKFERIVAYSRFRFVFLRPVPIKVVRHLWTTWTREFFTSVVQCKLVLR